MLPDQSFSFTWEGGTMKKAGDYVINYKLITIKMTDGSLITGRINIGVFRRFSDFFKELVDPFLVISEEEKPQRVVMVNKNYVLWAETQE
jgi:hypothetical protein